MKATNEPMLPIHDYPASIHDHIWPSISVNKPWMHWIAMVWPCFNCQDAMRIISSRRRLWALTAIHTKGAVIQMADVNRPLIGWFQFRHSTGHVDACPGHQKCYESWKRLIIPHGGWGLIATWVVQTYLLQTSVNLVKRTGKSVGTILWMFLGRMEKQNSNQPHHPCFRELLELFHELLESFGAYWSLPESQVLFRLMAQFSGGSLWRLEACIWRNWVFTPNISNLKVEQFDIHLQILGATLR